MGGYVPVSEDIMTADGAEREAWLEFRRATFRFFAAQLAAEISDPASLIIRWELEALR
jgi:hypothetical protein